MEDKNIYINMTALIDAGLLSCSEKLYGKYYEYKIEATINKDGTLVCGKNVYSSPSVAAGREITLLSNKTSPGRAYLSVNGWRFWYVTRNKNYKSLDELRNELTKTKI